TLLLAADQLVNQCTDGSVTYFPAYEIVNDELRDYRFYKPDMLHPSEQTVEYIWQKLSTHYFSERTLAFLEEWRHVKEALNHRPFHPESEEYKLFLEKTKEKAAEIKKKYGID
ncbi:MAG: GSCFA domain-containing protein, partial [Prevotella sp.]|nr:GSCFA domain-containing protein [Prevotella sp.]